MIQLIKINIKKVYFVQKKVLLQTTENAIVPKRT